MAVVAPLLLIDGGKAMKMKRTLIFLFGLSIASLGNAAFIANRDFLTVAQGARANAMGEAYAGVADDATAIFWNSAGLTQLREDQVSGSYADRFDGLAKETHVHYARRGRAAMWGVAYAGSFISDIPVTQSLSEADLAAIQAGTFAPTDQGGKNVTDNALLFSYARPLRQDSPHSVGTTIKLIYRDFLGMVQGYGSAVDLGYHYTFPSETLRFGVNAQNIASLVSYVGTLDNLGVKATATESYIANFKTGLAYTPTWRVLNGRVLLAFDINMLTSFDVEHYNAGVEYSFGEVVSLRAGKIFGRQDDSGEDYALGMGVKLKNLVLDFSFLSNELGETTRGTIGYKLGGDYYTPDRYK